MTRDEQTIYWHEYNRFLKRKQKDFLSKIYNALQGQIQGFIDTGISVSNIQNVSPEPINDILFELYKTAGVQFAHRAYVSVRRQAEKSRMPIGFNDAVVNDIINLLQIKLLNNAVFPITETTKEFIRQVLQDAEVKGSSYDEIVHELLNADLTKVRARLITRTELMKVSNEAEQMGVDRTGFETQKIWIAARDNRTRRDHLTTDGQVVNDGQPFTVGLENWKMLRPGDNKTTDGKDVPAGEICNCRCIIGRKVIRGSNGLPLKKEAGIKAGGFIKGMPIRVFSL